ncbi:MAG: hypothetical protein Q9170_007126 [Blastenia crenularia]
MQQATFGNSSPNLQLVGLPKEVLLQIIERYLEHDDLENFSMCCKHIHCLSKSALTIHLSLKQKYTTILLGDAVSQPSIGHFGFGLYPARFLVDAMRNEDTYGYVRHIVAGNCQPSEHIDQATEDAARLFYQPHFPNVQCRPRYGPRHPLHDNGTLGGKHRYWDYTFMNRFPRLVSLEMREKNIDSLQVSMANTVDLLQESMVDFISIPELRPIRRRIKELSIMFPSRCRWIVSFIRLESQFVFPGLHTFRCSAVYRRPPSQIELLFRRCFFSIQKDILQKNVQHFHFQDSLIIASDVSVLLQMQELNTLKTFELSMSTSRMKYTLEQRTLIVDVLRHHASESLESLDLSTPTEGGGFTASHSFVKSLGAFTRLRHLRLESELFAFFDALDVYPDTPVIARQPCTRFTIRSLPPALETLEIVRRDRVEGEMKWLLGTFELIRKLLPNLKRVRVVEPRKPI